MTKFDIRTFTNFIMNSLNFATAPQRVSAADLVVTTTIRLQFDGRSTANRRSVIRSQ